MKRLLCNYVPRLLRSSWSIELYTALQKTPRESGAKMRIVNSKALRNNRYKPLVIKRLMFLANFTQSTMNKISQQFKILLISFWGFLCFSCTQPAMKVESWFDNGNPKKIIVYSNPNNPLYYKSIVLYSNGDTAQINECFKGAKHGASMSFYQSGTVKEVSQFYRGGRVDTTLIFYDVQPPLLNEVIYYPEGSLVGESTLFFKDQRVLGNFSYYNVQRNGPFKLFYPSGLTHVAGTFHYDQLFGEFEEYFDHFHDTVIYVPDNGEPFLTTISTHKKVYRFYGLDSLLFEIEYDTSRAVVGAQGCLLCNQEKDTLLIRVGDVATQVWQTPMVENSKQYYIILNDALGIHDTISYLADSAIAKWSHDMKLPGKYEFKAVSHLEKDHFQMSDSTDFTVIVEE